MLTKRKAAFYIAKDGLLQRKTRPFTTQYTAFHNAAGQHPAGDKFQIKTFFLTVFTTANRNFVNYKQSFIHTYAALSCLYDIKTAFMKISSKTHKNKLLAPFYFDGIHTFTKFVGKSSDYETYTQL